MLGFKSVGGYSYTNDYMGSQREGKMGKFDLDAYETVADRLVRAHNQYADLRVITDLVHVERSADGKPLQYIVRAQVFIGDVLKAQDFAEEVVGSSPVNRTSALENCCTSAIGRALADMNFAGVDSKNKPVRPSREEMEKVARRENDETYERINKVIYSPDQIASAEILMPQVIASTSLEGLKSLYDLAIADNTLFIPVNGSTLNAEIQKRKKELDSAVKVEA